jgi:predicted secreted protein
VGDTIYLTVKKDKTLAVPLDANPSTGYQWIAEYDPNYLKLVRKDTFPSANLGGSVTEKFEFEALMSGITRLRMICKRIWENTSIDEKIYIIQII